MRSTYNFLFLVIAWLLVAPVSLSRTGANDACELAIKKLVVDMELEGKFELLRPASGLPGNSKQYSKCYVDPDSRNLFSVFLYHVYRVDDDVTIYVSRERKSSGQRRMFGPFYSAYRK